MIWKWSWKWAKNDLRMATMNNPNECKMETYLAFAKMNSKNYHFHLFCQCAGREKCIASFFYNFHSIFHFPCVCFSAKYTKMSWKWPKNGYHVWWTTLMFFFQVFCGFFQLEVGASWRFLRLRPKPGNYILKYWEYQKSKCSSQISKSGEDRHSSYAQLNEI